MLILFSLFRFGILLFGGLVMGFWSFVGFWLFTRFGPFFPASFPGIGVSLIKIAVKLVSTWTALLVLIIIFVLIVRKIEVATEVLSILIPKIVHFNFPANQVLHPGTSFLSEFHSLDCCLDRLRLIYWHLSLLPNWNSHIFVWVYIVPFSLCVGYSFLKYIKSFSSYDR